MTVVSRSLRGRCRLATAMAALAVITACSVGPDYVKPTVEAPPAFKEMSGWKRAEPKDDLLRGAWWEMYGDPQLNALEEQVDISNNNLVAAEAQFRQARALADAARSGYYPTVTVGATATRSHPPSNSGTRGDVSSFSLPFDASWEADVWGRIRRTVEASRAFAQASAADLANVRLSVHAQLAQDYFQLRVLDAEKRLLESTTADFAKSLELTKNRYAAGVVSRADVLQAEAQLKSATAQLIDIDVQRSQLEHAIALLIGKPAALFSLPPASGPLVLPAIPVAVPSEVLERRPDIAAAERRVAEANARIGVAEAAYYPRLTLSATTGFVSTSFSQWFSAASHVWSVGAGLAETLFDGGLRRAQTEEARAAYDEVVATYRQTTLTVFQEVEDNLVALRVLQDEAVVQDEAVTAARQSVAVVTNQYKAGLVNYLQVLVSQAAALNSERTAVQLLGRRMEASVLLIKALGGGWDSSLLPPADALHKGPVAQATQAR